ncbi:MAG: leucine-rich repeat protein [Muribaculaceae bacterium]|nr:leucine-rich repeat protein [Muribaculaceae bacterium]
MKKLFVIILAALLSGLTAARAQLLTGSIAVNGESVAAQFTKLSDSTVSLGSGRNACIPQFTQGFVTIPGEVTIDGTTYTVVEVNDVAFRLCNGITGVEIRENVTRVGKFAFVGCEKLAEVILPASLQSIGSGAFINTVSRQSESSVTCLGTTPPRWEYNDVFAFHDKGISQPEPVILPATVNLFVPDGCQETYREANYTDTSLGWTTPDGWGSFAVLSAGISVMHIYAPRDLEIVRQIVNHGGKYNFYKAIHLEKDIDMSGYTWDWGIGDNEEHPFTGNFYGNGHTISNLTVINKSEQTASYDYDGPAGLFSYFGGNIVDNVILRDCTFAGRDGVGAFAGISGSSTFSTVWVENCTYRVFDGFIGGIVGKDISTGGANLNHCVVKDLKRYNFDGFAPLGSSYHGGLVGMCAGAFIKNCAVIGSLRIAHETNSNQVYPLVNPFVGECNTGDVVQITRSYATDADFKGYTPADNIEYSNVVLEGNTPVSIKMAHSGLTVDTEIAGNYFTSLFMIPTLGLDDWVFQQGEYPLPLSFEDRMPVTVNVAEYRPTVPTSRVNGLSPASGTPWTCFLDLTDNGYRSKSYLAGTLWIDDNFPYDKEQVSAGMPSAYLPIGTATIAADGGVRYDRTLEVTPTGTTTHVITQVQTDDDGNPVRDEDGHYIPESEVTLYETPSYAATGHTVFLPYQLVINNTLRLFAPATVSADNGEAALNMAELDDDNIYPWTPYYAVVTDAPVSLGTGNSVIITPRPASTRIAFGTSSGYAMYGTTNPQTADQMEGRFVLGSDDTFVPATEALPAWRAYFSLPRGIDRMTATRELKLADGNDNDATINDFDGCKANVTLQGRKFVKDGTWYTLCLPFDVDYLTGTPLDDATICHLESSTVDEDDGSLSLNFLYDGSIKAGKPYLIKWEPGETVSDPTFMGVTIDANSYEMVSVGKVSMFGLYSPLYVPKDANVLYMGDNNRLYFARDNITINAFRACLHYNGSGSSGASSAPSAVKLNFLAKPVVTGVDDVKVINVRNDNNWYSVDGRVYREKPSAPGIYINNGKKIIIN